MKTRKLGLDGPDVSAIGLGCMSFAGSFGATDKAESFECLDSASHLHGAPLRFRRQPDPKQLRVFNALQCFRF